MNGWSPADDSENCFIEGDNIYPEGLEMKGVECSVSLRRIYEQEEYSILHILCAFLSGQETSITHGRKTSVKITRCPN